MEHGDSIIGNHIHAILEQLKNGKTLVRMKLMGKDYEQLSIINDIRKKDKTQLIILTYFYFGEPMVNSPCGNFINNL